MQETEQRFQPPDRQATAATAARGPRPRKRRLTPETSSVRQPPSSEKQRKHVQSPAQPSPPAARTLSSSAQGRPLPENPPPGGSPVRIRPPGTCRANAVLSRLGTWPSASAEPCVLGFTRLFPFLMVPLEAQKLSAPVTFGSFCSLSSLVVLLTSKKPWARLRALRDPRNRRASLGRSW